MIDNRLHDEITYHGKPLIVDTADLGPSYNNRYETMALCHGGRDLETVRTAALEDAERAHALMLRKYSGEPGAPLTGKYAKLRDDLLAAYIATESIEQTEDGGTCNFDSPTLHLPRWNAEKIKQAAKEAGGSAFKWTVGGSLLGWVFSPRSSGQANRRSRRAEAISAYLKNLGYDAGMYCAMD